MKYVKRLGCFVMALIMLCSLMVVPAFAADEVELGSVTINGASKESKYDIYCLLDLKSYDLNSATYRYEINSAWAGFFETDVAQDYIATVEGVLKWVAADEADATVAAFAKEALAYAKANEIDPVKTSENVNTDGTITFVNDSTLKFTDLPLGYYLVDSNVGALCGLTTTNPNASINAKNGRPTIDKQVQEDSTSQWAGENSADIGQIVNFRVTINVHPGAENYVLHDVMSNGLTFKGVSKIEHVIPGTTTNTHSVDAKYYTVLVRDDVDNLDGKKDYNSPACSDCTFEVEFSKEFCDLLTANDKVIVYYEAMLNRGAVIAGDGNSNGARLEYGEENYTEFDSTYTKTYGFDLVKTDSQNKLIDGAEFVIYDAETEGNPVPVVLMDDGKTYRRARADENGVNIVVKNGKVRIVGLDNGTYYLEETEVPDGYTALAGRQKFTIADSNLDAVFNKDTNGNDIFSTGSGVHVVNKSGTILPETGGIGTTLFYVGGGVLVFAAVVLLVTKKRMESKG